MRSPEREALMTQGNNKRAVPRIGLAAVVLMVVIVGAVVTAHGNNDGEWIGLSKKSAISSQVGKVSQSHEVFESPVALDVWQERDETKFRASMAKILERTGERVDMDVLVGEWKLAHTEQVVPAHVRVVTSADGVTWHGPAGGNGGSSFGSYSGSNVDKFCGRSGSLIDAIYVHFEDGHTLSAGGSGGGYFCWTPPSGCIKKVIVRSGSLIDSLEFEDSEGHTSSQFGGNGGSSNTYTSSGCLQGIKGRSGSLIDQLYFGF